MKNALITGSGGLIGSEAVKFFSEKGFNIIGIDNNMRRYFFGEEGDTDWNVQKLKKQIPNYVHHDVNIRDKEDNRMEAKERYNQNT